MYCNKVRMREKYCVENLKKKTVDLLGNIDSLYGINLFLVFGVLKQRKTWDNGFKKYIKQDGHF